MSLQPQKGTKISEVDMYKGVIQFLSLFHLMESCRGTSSPRKKLAAHEGCSVHLSSTSHKNDPCANLARSHFLIQLRLSSHTPIPQALAPLKCPNLPGKTHETLIDREEISIEVSMASKVGCQHFRAESSIKMLATNGILNQDNPEPLSLQQLNYL